MVDQTEAIFAKHKQEESQQRDREQLENEAKNRWTDLLNAFLAIRSPTRGAYHQETGNDPGIHELPGKIPPASDGYWHWWAELILKVGQSLHGWESELERFLPQTDSQQVAMAILQAGKDGDRKHVVGLLVRLKPTPKLMGEVQIDMGQTIPEALAGIACGVLQGEQQEQPVINRSADRRDPADLKELVLAELQRHHQFDGDSVLNDAPAKQADLCKAVGLDYSRQKGRISEVFKQLFGSHSDYCRLCRNEDKLRQKLQELTGQKPKATASEDRIDGLVGSDEGLIDEILDRSNTGGSS